MREKKTNVKEMSDDELITEFKALYEAIYVTDCFGTKDLIWEEVLEQEIERRGYRITPSVEVVKENRD